VDLRRLNSITVRDVYPLPRIDDMLDRLRKAKYITTVDLKSGFWQLPVAKEDRDKFAFIYAGGHDQYNFMPFGWNNKVR
jgi:hypothetical protein